MKKLLLAVSVVTLCVLARLSAAPQGKVPEADSQQAIQTTDYYGVDIATSAFSAIVTTVIPVNSNVLVGKYRVYGVQFTTGVCGANDYVDLYDSTAAPTIPTTNGFFQPTLRLYNINISSSVGLSAAAAGCSGYSTPPRPVRFYRGLMFKPSVATYNMINVFYWKETE